MLFLILITLGALTLAGTAIFFSVLGLVQTFSFTALFWGSAIEASKLLVASFLTRFWKRVGIGTRILGVAAVIILMIITSAGIYGHILSSYQEGTIEIESQEILLEEAEENVNRISSRLQRLDTNIEDTQRDIEQANQTIREIVGREDAYITARTEQASTVREDRSNLEDRLERFQNEHDNLSERYENYQERYLELREEMLIVESRVGPIITVISIIGDEAGERAMLWFVLMIVLVFDPVAVYLTIQANRVAMFRKRDKEEKVLEQFQGRDNPSQQDHSISNKLDSLIESNADTQSKLSEVEKSVLKDKKKRDIKKDLMKD